MARLAAAVTSTTCSMPEATAPSTMYWITGLSTMGSISFGIAFEAGRKRVPSPAAGMTALRTRLTRGELLYHLTSMLHPAAEHCWQFQPRPGPGPVTALAGARHALRGL